MTLHSITNIIIITLYYHLYSHNKLNIVLFKLIFFAIFDAFIFFWMIPFIIEIGPGFKKY